MPTACESVRVMVLTPPMSRACPAAGPSKNISHGDTIDDALRRWSSHKPTTTPHFFLPHAVSSSPPKTFSAADYRATAAPSYSHNGGSKTPKVPTFVAPHQPFEIVVTASANRPRDASNSVDAFHPAEELKHHRAESITELGRSRLCPHTRRRTVVASRRQIRRRIEPGAMPNPPTWRARVG